MSKNNDADIKRFTELFSGINREGANKLLAYIEEKSDFYTAPASTKYHSCYEGGLLKHSLNVYDRLMVKKLDPSWGDFLKNIEHETILITGLLHDFCKTNFYTVEMRNKKVYSEKGSKSDSNGRYDWESVPCYTIDDKNPYGHGEKSVMMIEGFMKLKPVERYAVRWHMGFTEPKENWGTLCAAIRKYPLILAIFEADLEATYLLEKEE